MIAEAPAASSVRNLERLLRPRSVAVVGASSTPGALGASVVANLERMGFGGEIHLINPKRDSIGERRCLPSVAELPMGVDVAVLAIPRVAVIETVRELVKRQVGAAIIFPHALPRAAKRAWPINASLRASRPTAAWSSRAPIAWDWSTT
jgi:acetate---CoA ligase (ADP-forming)